MHLAIYDQPGKRYDFQRNAASVMEMIRDGGLAIATDLRPQSRLSCQIRVNPALDGLIVKLAPGTEF